MYHWTEYAQTNAQPRPLSDKKDFGICPLIPELEPREVHTLGLHHPVFSASSIAVPAMLPSALMLRHVEGTPKKGVQSLCTTQFVTQYRSDLQNA